MGILKQKAKRKSILGEARLAVGGSLNRLLPSVGTSQGVGSVHNYSMSQSQTRRFGKYTSPGGM